MGIPRRRERGQVLVVFALSLTSILAVIGLLYTFGLVLTQRRALQTTADAASLRGSFQVLQELASDDLRDAQVLSEVVRFASLNGSVPSNSVLTAFYVDASGALLSPSVQVGSAPGGKFPSNARGTQITVQNQVQTILPNFLSGWQAVAVRDNATATARPTTLTSAGLVVPIAVSNSDALLAYSGHTTYNLFAANARTLDLTTTRRADLSANPALSYGSPATNAQFWSDGAHSGSWQMTEPGTVDLADALYHAEIATGLGANVSRQVLNDASGAADPAYALVMVPVYDTATSTSIHLVGFAEFKIRRDHLSAASAVGTFVPYATAPWGPYATPAVPDFGAALVSLVS
jgi:Putative Flp pilus-assembly TadE/G-like